MDQSVILPPGREFALFTDLYELTMLQAYVEEQMFDEAVFSLAVRRLPRMRNYLLACGLDAVLSYLETLQFAAEDLAYLERLSLFSKNFLNWLSDFRFHGSVYAVPEGTPVFANEPILEVEASLPEAQLIETFVMNQINLQTALASKAARVVSAAQGRTVVDFSPRRTHGTEAALEGARAFYIAGVAATSNVLAGRRYGIPIAGTMAHSYVQAHESEMAAFEAFARQYPQTTLLVDTYDTLRGVQRVIELSRTLGDRFKVHAVRLDSGDLAELAKQTRKLLDDAGLHQVEIFASGGLDDAAIASMLASGAPIDGFGVGTSMGVSSDAPDLDIAYKLCAYAGRGRLKLSTGKPILPGRKQVFRLSENGRDIHDIIGRADEIQPGRPLLQKVMSDGRRLSSEPTDLVASRKRACDAIGRLPPRLHALTPAVPPYPVSVSLSLSAYHDAVKREWSRG